MDIKWIRTQVADGNYEFRLHALERASERGIYPVEIKEALFDGEIIEDYPNDKRGYSCLVYGKSKGGKAIHLVCGIAYDRLWIVTVYEPDILDWIDPKTRKK